ncbi:hypothetical protein ILUMI_10588 [Ignelater luminosus]|uniref:Uncharacterized protein n=1 Tax=Ignelater luminosus TaxID=2038154 RepID=A0A8K0GBC0_IGNLU|nr:hypothetical protein ILUMI_10588 [Ignelater luminosus]
MTHAFSSDLTPSGFSLFPYLKKLHAGKKYESDEDVITDTNAYFDQLDERAYRDGIKALKHRKILGYSTSGVAQDDSRESQFACSSNAVKHNKFMVSGHSYMECDVDDALIEKQKKKLPVQIKHPHDWYRLVKTVGRARKFIVKEVACEMFYKFCPALSENTAT